jgi:hypothetical protein
MAVLRQRRGGLGVAALFSALKGTGAGGAGHAPGS